jgi:predicted ester cyclase
VKLLPWSAGVAVCGLVLSVLLSVAGCAQPDPSERIKPHLDTYLRAWNTGDFKGLEEAVSSQFELRSSPLFEPVRGLDSLKYSITSLRAAYPDLQITAEETIYATNAITVRWTFRGTNSGPGQQPPTGKAVNVPGMSILHVSAGKLTDEWIAGNDLYWSEQLGYSLAPTSPGK